MFKTNSLKWLPEKEEQFQEFVCMATQSDLNFLNQQINLLKFTPKQLLNLQSQIKREEVVRRYFSYPPSNFLKKFVDEYDNEKNIKQEVESKYSAIIKDIETNKDLREEEKKLKIKEIGEQASKEFNFVLNKKKQEKQDVIDKFEKMNLELKGLNLSIVE